jgi:hypothetical protein
MMSPSRTRQQRAHSAFSIEERICRARYQLSLVADLFALYGTPCNVDSPHFSAGAAHACATACRLAGNDLRTVLSTIPVRVLNMDTPSA